MLATISTSAKPAELPSNMPMSPLPLTAGGRQWRLLRLVRRKRRRSTSSSSSSLGSQIPFLIAVKLAIYRLIRDYEAKITRGWGPWWGCARQAMNAIVGMPGRIVRGALRIVGAKATLVVTLISILALPAMVAS